MVTKATERAVKTDKEGDDNWHHYAHCAKVVDHTLGSGEYNEDPGESRGTGQ